MKSTVLLICLAVAVGLLATTQSKSDEQGKDATPSKPDASDKFIGREAGQVRDDNGLKMKLVWCPPGIFTMENCEVITGPAVEKENQPNDDDVVDPKDKPAPEPRLMTKITPVRVFLTKGYWLGKYEVTQSEWRQIMKTEPWKDQPLAKEGPDFAATFISWNDAMAFCRKLTDQERPAGRLPDGYEYTLPTEAQWERACRARTETKFSFGDDESKLGEYAWFFDNALGAGENYAHRVGQLNPWGLYDMHGNAWEWCRDICTEKLPGGRDPEVQSDKKEEGVYRVFRGGGWSIVARGCGSAFRFIPSPGFRNDGIDGFRLALSSVRPVKQAEPERSEGEKGPPRIQFEDGERSHPGFNLWARYDRRTK